MANTSTRPSYTLRRYYPLLGVKHMCAVITYLRYTYQQSEYQRLFFILKSAHLEMLMIESA